MKSKMLAIAMGFLVTGGLSACLAPLSVTYPNEVPYGYFGDDDVGIEGDGPEDEELAGVHDPYDWYFNVKLNRYGEWIHLPGYGRVWRPWVVEDWLPYSIGYWTWTGTDWMWISYEPFGYVVYHFGTWAWMGRQGWCWFPGHTWAPNHVRWFEWEGYVGWYPSSPPLSIHLDIDLDWDRFMWIPRGYFLEQELWRRREPHPRGPGGGLHPHNLPRIPRPTVSMVERWTGRQPNWVRTDELWRRTRHGDVRFFVPDKKTRDRVGKEGSKIARPWLKPKKSSSSPPSPKRESKGSWRGKD